MEGLSPDAVSVLDMNGNLLGPAQDSGNPGRSGGLRSVARLPPQNRSRPVWLKSTPRWSPCWEPNKFRAGVSVECDFTGGEQSEEIFDPARSVMLSSQRTEDSSGSSGGSGVPGTASTLPRPTSRPGSQLEPCVARHREHHLPDQPHREEDPPAGRRRAQDVAGGPARPGRHLGKGQERHAARAGAAQPRKDSRSSATWWPESPGSTPNGATSWSSRPCRSNRLSRSSRRRPPAAPRRPRPPGRSASPCAGTARP